MSKPTYIKIKESIQKKIQDGELVPGDALPSERTLAESYGLSRMTVRGGSFRAGCGRLRSTVNRAEVRSYPHGK